ncbi:MAG: glycosyltransferase [Actinomycetota bacterium]|nr:glycosyltransferase [Actinomycetota bacterium]
MSNPLRVIAVVVTWNRRDLLVETLDALAAQTRPVDEVVVVDNASDDGTAELLGQRAAGTGLDVVALRRNIGGAGGFAAGLRRALEHHDPDLVWLMDDDTVPLPRALAGLLDTRGRYAGPPPALLASRVQWTDGRDHPMNTPRRKPLVRGPEARRALLAGALAIRSASFVSIAVDASAVRERGLPLADYFLWNDDFEFSTRLLRGKVGLLCPDSLVVHKTRAFGSTDADPGERFFYEVRNKVWLFTRSNGLSPVEKAVYAGSTVRRWGRTFAASPNRANLRRALRRGLVAGLRSGPRPTDEVLARAGADG